MIFLNEISIATCPLFIGINVKDIKAILNCLDAKEKSFSKGSYILNAGDKPDYMGIVTAGQVNIIKEDIAGNRTVISNLLPFQIFGESFSIAKVNMYPVSVQAAADSTVILLKSDKITSTCENACIFHKRLIDNMLKLIARKNINLNKRIDCVTQKTTRQKLIFYLAYEMQMERKYEVKIPFNRDELADYLGVNRSALSREISKLHNDGIISFDKNKFKILDIKKLQDVINY